MIHANRGAVRVDNSIRKRRSNKVLGVVAGSVVALALAWAAWVKNSTGRALSGVFSNIGSAAGVVVGVTSLYISWRGYKAQRGEHAAGFNLTGIADELAVAVRGQWEAEARIRRVDNPYPLPVSWAPARDELVEPWPLLVQRATAAADRSAPLPSWAGGPQALTGAGTEIVELLKERVPDQRLLILGDPGAGKTVLLVRLLLGLLARRRSSDPLPVIFPLASWNPADQPLEVWMAERLEVDHPALTLTAPGILSGHSDRPVTRAQALLSQRLILPLLDGFDELPPRLRPIALDAINRTLPPGHGVVLSSRTSEYHDALAASDGVPVRLTAAAGIELRPLDAEESADYLVLDAGGDSMSADRWQPVLTRQREAPDSPVGIALRTPLMLFLARTVYNPRPGERPAGLPDPSQLCDTARFPTAEAIRIHLFDAFIPAAYRPRPGHPVRWAHEHAERTLTYLARHLQHERRSSVDLAWWQLRSALPRWVPEVLAGVAIGLVLILGNVLYTLASLADPSLVELANHVTAALYYGPADRVLDIVPFHQSGWEDILGAFAWQAPLCMSLGLLLSVLFALRGRWTPAFRARWSLTRWSVLRGIGAGTLAGTFSFLIVDLRLGITWGLFFACVFWLFGGWSTTPADISTATDPDGVLAQDRRTFWYLVRTACLMGGAAYGITLGVSVNFLPEGLGGGGVSDTVLGVALGFATAGMWNGVAVGLATAFHRTAWGEFTIARHWLALRHGLPQDLMPFLKDAHETRAVLRRVGPVYQFRHIDLQRHLASRPAP